VAWQLVHQQVTVRSSPDSEAAYSTASVTGTKVTYLRSLMDKLGFPQDRLTTL
jgi:hypothetical protein